MNTVNNLINWIKSVLTMMSGTANNIDDTASVYAVHILRTVGFFLLICGLFVAAKMVVGVYVASALVFAAVWFLRGFIIIQNGINQAVLGYDSIILNAICLAFASVACPALVYALLIVFFVFLVDFVA